MIESGVLFGKKVFFLNPPGVLSDVVAALNANEFEIYLVYDHKKLARYLSKKPEAILFVNIDEGLSEPEWEAWIRSVKQNPATASVGLGVVTMLNDADLSRKYLMDIGLTCGFVILKIGAAKTTDILLKTLEANEARGRRKYIRSACPSGTADLTVLAEDATLRGNIMDISIVGMAVWFDSPDAIPVGARLKEIQLTLRGVRIFVNGVVVGKRTAEGEAAVHVVLFEPGSLSDEKKDKLRSYIRRVLQDEVNRELELS